MFSPLTFNCVLLLLLLLLTRSLEDKFEVEVGKNAYLPCNYTLPSPGTPVPVCWGKESCPWSRCTNEVLNTDERKVTYQKSSRYQLKGNFLKGDVSLTIENVTLDDHGTYCCRVQFPGPWNDKKLDLKLVITSAKFTLPATAHGNPATTSPRTPTTEGDGSRWRHEHRGMCLQISTWSDEMKDSGETIRTAVYIGVGVSAGLALALIFGVLILKCKLLVLYFHSLITLANLPPVGLVNAGAGRNRSEENVYTIEENIYEMENSNEYYCYISGGQPS
uniref:Hepatitis A virus cellular receptor 2 n=1 Tax=Peromyscus maniculatus bairdii TaxID=230844 RepID=A0A8C8TY72_PERMB